MAAFIVVHGSPRCMSNLEPNGCGRKHELTRTRSQILRVINRSTVGCCYVVLLLVMVRPIAHVDVQLVTWCIPGASLVPPRCLPGASLVHTRCLPGASLQSSTWSQGRLWLFQKVLGARVGSTSGLNGPTWPPEDGPGTKSTTAGMHQGCTKDAPRMHRGGLRSRPRPLFNFIFLFFSPI